MGPIGAALAAGGLDIAGGFLSNQFAKDQQQSNFEFQREMAKNGIRWRVEDAKAAGLHPLAALGSAFTSGSPVVLEDSIGPALSRAGQSVANAVARTQTPAEVEAAALENEWKRAQIKRTDMDTMLMGIQAADIGRRMQDAWGAPGPGDRSAVVPAGQQPKAPNQGSVDVQAPPRMSNVPGKQWLEAGYIPGAMLVKMPFGHMYLPSTSGTESWSEVWSEMPWYEKQAWIRFNGRMLGEGWENKAWQWYTGMKRTPWNALKPGQEPGRDLERRKYNEKLPSQR